MTDKRAVVFSPSPVLTVTVEGRPDGADEIHLHAGGQGFWIARMAAVLGLDVRLCAPFGGEVGEVIIPLIEREQVTVRPVMIAGSNAAYVHDRRDGARQEVAQMPSAPLTRHELDDLYSTTLSEAMAADVAIVAGPDHSVAIPAEAYRRLTSDLSALGVRAVADLSADALE